MAAGEMTPALPPGFVLEGDKGAPPLPPGFVLESAHEDNAYDTDRDYSPTQKLARAGRAALTEVSTPEKGEATARPIEKAATGVAEAALSQGTGMLGAAAGGLAGAFTAAKEMTPKFSLAGYEFGGGGQDFDTAMQRGAQTSASVQDSMTYQPRGATGKLANSLVATPFELLSELGGNVGGAVGSAFGPKAEAAGRSIGEAVPGAAAALLGGKAMLRAAPEVAALKPGLPATAAAGADAAIERIHGPDPVSRARALIGKTKLDWSQLPIKVRAQLSELAKDATSFDKLDPNAVELQVRMQNLPVPINRATKGQYSREAPQLRTEQNIAATESGAPIREIYNEQNRALTGSLDVLKGRTGARGKDAEAVGQRVAGEGTKGESAPGALKMAEEKSMDNVNALYKKARANGEMEGTIDLAPMIEHIRTHDNPSTISFATGKLKALKLVKEDEYGNLTPTHNITLNQLEEIRKAAATSARLSSDGTVRHYSGELVGAIDKMIPDNAGGALYKAARGARKEHAMQYEEPQAISSLISDKTRTDRKVALENVWGNAVLKGSIADLNRVRSTLLDQADRQTRDSGRKAWRDIAGQTVQWIKDQSTKDLATNEAGEKNFSPSGLNSALEKIGRKKLEIVLGKQMSDKLHEVRDIAVRLKTKPGTGIAGSDTVPNALVLLERFGKIINHLPLIGGTAGQIVKGVSTMGRKAYEAGSTSEKVKAATEFEPGADIRKAQKDENRKNALRRARALARAKATESTAAVSATVNKSNDDDPIGFFQ